jgi:hypothetical protein
MAVRCVADVRAGVELVGAMAAKARGIGVIGFFGMMGMVAFSRTQKLIKTLKENGVLDKDTI